MERKEIKRGISFASKTLQIKTFSGEHPNSYFLAKAGANKADALLWL